MHDTNTKITNIKAYMVTALYNAPSTINHYYQQEVQHDMYGGGWNEKYIGYNCASGIVAGSLDDNLLSDLQISRRIKQMIFRRKWKMTGFVSWCG